MASRAALIRAVPARSMLPARGARDSSMARGANASAPPAQAGRIERHQRAADDLAADRGQSHHHAVDRQRAHAVGAIVGDVDDGEDIRHQQRCPRALENAREHELAGARRQSAQRGGDGEQSQAPAERPAAAVPVAEPPGGDQEHGRAQRVAGHDPFDGPVAGVQARLDRGQSDVDDEEVQHDHEGAGQDDGEGCPAGEWCVSHAATVPARVRGVDYLRGNGAYGLCATTNVR
jgi:hypothetical protein